MRTRSGSSHLLLAAVAAMVAVTLVRSKRGRSLLALAVRAVADARKANAAQGDTPPF